MGQASGVYKVVSYKSANTAGIADKVLVASILNVDLDPFRHRVLLDKGDDIGLATVYRVLTQFEAAGLVLKHNFEGGQAVYELNQGEHHDHMVDLDTGKVIEFHSDEIEALQQAIAAKHGYEIEDHALVLYVRKKRK